MVWNESRDVYRMLERRTRVAAMALSTFDWIIVVFGVLCIIRGIMRGAVSQVFGIAGLLAGFVLASSLFGDVALKLTQSFPQFPAAQPVSFGILFFLTWLCIAIVGFWLSRLVHLTGLAFWDRCCGGVLGAFKASLFAVVAVSFLTALLTTQHAMLKGSVVAPHALEAAQWLVRVVPGNLQSLLEKQGEEMKRHRRDGDTGGKDQHKPQKKEGRSV
jgi:membrane protein required for colicin V production